MEENCNLDGSLCVFVCVVSILNVGCIESATGYYPRLMLLIPHFILIGIILATRPSGSQTSQKNPSSVSQANTTEGSVAWQKNLRAIQNLMGAMYVFRLYLSAAQLIVITQL